MTIKVATNFLTYYSRMTWKLRWMICAFMILSRSALT